MGLPLIHVVMLAFPKAPGVGAIGLRWAARMPITGNHGSRAVGECTRGASLAAFQGFAMAPELPLALLCQRWRRAATALLAVAGQGAGRGLTRCGFFRMNSATVSRDVLTAGHTTSQKRNPVMRRAQKTAIQT